tara:strand:- start:723 stop:959 length:237 start_codon:yes stop_codon:yes gene_type:complete
MVNGGLEFTEEEKRELWKINNSGLYSRIDDLESHNERILKGKFGSGTLAQSVVNHNLEIINYIRHILRARKWKDALKV